MAVDEEGIGSKTEQPCDLDGELKTLRGQYEQSVIDRLAAEQSLRASQAEEDRLSNEVDHLVNERNILAERLSNSQSALQAALNSRAWRYAEKIRGTDAALARGLALGVWRSPIGGSRAGGPAPRWIDSVCECTEW